MRRRCSSLIVHPPSSKRDAVRADPNGMLCGQIHVATGGAAGPVERRRCAVLEPAELYEVAPDAPQLDEPVLLVALDGFVDAGNAARLAVEALRDGQRAAPVVRFDVDQLARLPLTAPAAAVRDRPLGRLQPRRSWTSWRSPTPATPTTCCWPGPEPDTQWERFCRRRRAAGAPARRPARDQPDGDPDGRAAHPADRRHGARHPPRADRGPRGLVRHGATSRAARSALMEFRLGEAGHWTRWASPCTCRTTWRAPSTRRPRACCWTTSGWPPGCTCPPRRCHEGRRAGRGGDRRAGGRLGGGAAGGGGAGAAVRHGGLRARRARRAWGWAGELPSADELAAEVERFLAGQDDEDDGRS